MNRELNSTRFIGGCAASYLASIRGFIDAHVVGPLAQIRGNHGMYDALERHEEWDEYTDLSFGASGWYGVLPPGHIF